MVTLEKDQPMLTLPEYLVLVAGTYNNNDLVDVYRSDQPTQVVAFFAQFIATGIQP